MLPELYEDLYMKAWFDMLDLLGITKARQVLGGRDAYEILGLKPSADWTAIRRAYTTLARRWHPDTGGDAERFREVQAAYELIKAEWDG